MDRSHFCPVCGCVPHTHGRCSINTGQTVDSGTLQLQHHEILKFIGLKGASTVCFFCLFVCLLLRRARPRKGSSSTEATPEEESRLTPCTIGLWVSTEKAADKGCVSKAFRSHSSWAGPDRGSQGCPLVAAL